MRILRFILLTVNALALLALWASALAQNVPPQDNSLMALLCFIFPICVIANLVVAVLWLFVRWRYAIGSVVGVLLCMQGLYTYMPLFGGGDAEEGDDVLKFMTFNTHSWGMVAHDNEMVRWVIDQRPHVVALQEASLDMRYMQPFVDAGYEVLRPEAQRSAAIVTRLPVIDYATLDMPTLDHNGALSAHVVWGGDTLTVVSVHFESFHFRESDKGELRNVVTMGDSARAHGRHLIDKMRPILEEHGLQADYMAGYIDGELAAGRCVVLGGDFNDLPNSYACGTMRSRLTDCYRAAGRGLGFTYEDDYMHFRIDHIFCSPSLKPLSTVLGDPPQGSDHKPIITWLRRR